MLSQCLARCKRRGTCQYHPTPARSDKPEWDHWQVSSIHDLFSLFLRSKRATPAAESDSHHNCARPQRPQHTGERGNAENRKAINPWTPHHSAPTCAMTMPACRPRCRLSPSPRRCSVPIRPRGLELWAFRAPCACRVPRQKTTAAPSSCSATPDRQQKRCESWLHKFSSCRAGQSSSLWAVTGERGKQGFLCELRFRLRIKAGQLGRRFQPPSFFCPVRCTGRFNCVLCLFYFCSGQRRHSMEYVSS
jgi:hypothetical protein